MRKQSRSKGRTPKKDERKPKVEGLAGEIISALPKDTSPEIIERITELTAFSGPLPPASMLREYEATLPGMADRVVAMAEKEQEIRKRDNKHILYNGTFKISGSILVSLSLVVAGVFCGVIGQPWLGGVLGTSGAVTGIIRAAFVK